MPQLMCDQLVHGDGRSGLPIHHASWKKNSIHPSYYYYYFQRAIVVKMCIVLLMLIDVPTCSMLLGLLPLQWSYLDR